MELKNKGNISNLQGAAINGASGSGNKIDLSVVEGKVLDILASSTLGIYASAWVENPGQVKAGSVIYRVPELIKSSSYNIDDNESQRPNIGTITLNLDTLRTIKYELETFDLDATENSGVIESQIAQASAQALMAELDLIFLKHLSREAKRTVYSNLLSFDDKSLKKSRILLGDLQTEISTPITKTMIGANEKETIAITSPKFYSRLIEGASAVGGDKAIDMKLSGDIPGAMINGNAITKHIYLGQDVDSSIFSDIPKDKDSNFSEIQAFVVNRQAVAFAFDIKEIVQTISPKTGNPIYMTKYRYGIKTLRDNMIKALVLNDNVATDTENANKKAVVNTQE